MADNQMDEYEAQDKRIRERMDKIGRKIMIMSGKGGVGKTTVTVNLANALVDMGCRVGVLDTDLHGPNVAVMFGCKDAELMSEDGHTFIPVTPRPGLKVMSLAFALEDPDAPVIWRGSLKNSAIRQFLSDVEWGELDYLLIDTPPGTGDEQLTVCQSIPELTGSIIVTTPQEVAVLDARRSVNFSRKLGVAIIGVIENMSGLICPHCKEEIPIFGKGGGKKMCQEMHVPFLGAIPMEIGLPEAEDEGKEWVAETGHPSAEALKAIANEFYGRGLRIIEVYKHQFQDLNEVIAQIKNRNYKFILYMDDLSFEEFEIEYKYLKAVIEGGLEKKPDNILIYATSNRRHLIRESFKDKQERDEELHTNDTVQEKLSLVSRFGVTIYFGSPDKKQFQTIVKALADRAGLEMEEQQLYLQANRWELSHGGLSGRTAQQFIDYLLGKESL